MKKFSGFFLGALVLAGLMAAFLLGNALAATGCFSDTNGHWAETYICWLKDNGISTGYQDGTFKPNNNITRAEMGVMLQRANAVPPQSGQILFTAGNTNWLPYSSTDSLQYINAGVFTRLIKPVPGLIYYTVQPDFTPVLYGKSLLFQGVQFCFNAEVNAYLTYIELDTSRSSSGTGVVISQYVSDTDYISGSCQYFALPTPVVYTAQDSVSFFIGLEWVVGGAFFDIGRTTFVFQPTGTAAVSPVSVSGDTVILEMGTGESPIPLP